MIAGTGNDPDTNSSDTPGNCPGDGPYTNPAKNTKNSPDKNPHSPHNRYPDNNPAQSLHMNKSSRTSAMISRVTGWQKNLSGRLRKRLETFDQQIGAFSQRRWQ